MRNSEILTTPPHSEELKEYISYYYLHFSTDPFNIERITYYPNVFNALTIYKDSILDFHHNFSIANPTNRDTYHMYYGGIQKMYRIAEMKGAFTKLGIVFNPLGINHFMNVPLTSALSKKENLMFNFFDRSMGSTLEQVFSTKNLSIQAKLLDDYFLSQLINFEENSLKKAIFAIHKSNHKYKVADLAEAVCTTQKTLSRKFKTHLNCTIKEYIEIDQFRKSFNNYLNTEDKLKLGESTLR